MQLQIHNYRSCSHLLESETGLWDVIVILDSRLSHSEFVETKTRESIQLFFDDITKPSPNLVAPNYANVAPATEFGLNSNKTIVSCRAGQSRSAAIAFSIAFAKFGKERAFGILDPKWHRPNERVVEIAAQVIDRPGIVDALFEWKSNIEPPEAGHFLRMAKAIETSLTKLNAVDLVSHQGTG